MTEPTLQSTAERHGGFVAEVSGDRVALLHDGEQALPAMLDAIASARFEIVLEMYWFDSDATGRRFADALCRKARQGVDVWVIYDAVGSLDADGAMFDRIRRAGGRVRQYGPIAPWRRRFNIGLLNKRDHRKILVVDRRIGFTGGINLCDHSAPERDGGSGWRDDVIGVDGSAAEQLRHVFLDNWARLVNADSDGTVPSRPPAVQHPTVQVLANRYRGERRAIRRAYLDRIRRAKERIYIANSYFIPDRVVRRALAEAAARGVDVRVLLPGESDVAAVQFASRRLYSWLMRRGIRLYEWQGTVLHSKTAAIDDSWCTVGTYNLDWRSFRLNLEVTVVVEDERVVTALADRFERDLSRSLPIRARDWRFRSPSQRLLEHFFFLFRKVL